MLCMCEKYGRLQTKCARNRCQTKVNAMHHVKKEAPASKKQTQKWRSNHQASRMHIREVQLAGDIEAADAALPETNQPWGADTGC